MNPDAIIRDFKSEIDAFRTRHGIAESSFGKIAVGDPSFMLELRNGRVPSLRTIARIQKFIRDFRPR